MADEGNTTNESQGYEEKTYEPTPHLTRLDRLVGTWELSGDVGGSVTYEWMEGGFFLIQRINMVQEDGSTSTGMEVIGHERPLWEEPSADVKGRYYSDTGGTLDYTYELDGDTLTIWFGERGSPAYYRGTLSEDDNKLIGAWHYPGGGYEAISTRVR